MTGENISSILEVLDRRARQDTDKTAYTFLRDGEKDEIPISYGQLRQRVVLVAGLLQAKGVPGERVLLIFPSGLDYIIAFLGCLYAGMVAVPVYPQDPYGSARGVQRLKNIAKNAAPSLVLTTSVNLSSAKDSWGRDPMFAQMKWISTDRIDPDGAAPFKRVSIGPDTLAFLQYTSGSTGQPKGVMVSHGNILHNQSMILKVMGHNSAQPFVSWLPLYHDMGLIGNIIYSLFLGNHLIFMTPQSFLEKPLRWLSAISRHRAVYSVAPNFAYDLCVKKILRTDRELLDLCCWQTAISGSESVRAGTIDRFYDAFGPCGFRKEAFVPCYGIAEATLIVTGADFNTLPARVHLSYKDLAENRVVEVKEDQDHKVTMVGCGTTCLKQQVKIVDPGDMTEVLPGGIGEIWIRGDSVSKGYWRLPQESRSTFDASIRDSSQGRFLRTGDLGFIMNKELFITGRIKDVIVIRGRNYYPQDIEASLTFGHPLLRPGCCAAFSVNIDDEEKLVVLGEVKKKTLTGDESADLVLGIQKSVAKHHDLKVYCIVLIKAKTIFKTSSGKLQRFACKKAFLDNQLDIIYTAQPQGQALLVVDEPVQSAILMALKETVDPNTKKVLTLLYLQEQAALLLDISPDRVQTCEPVYLLGFDSLLFFEFKSTIETGLGLKLDIDDQFSQKSIDQLSGCLTPHSGDRITS